MKTATESTKPFPCQHKRDVEERRARSLDAAILAFARGSADTSGVRALLDAASKIDAFVVSGKVPKK